MQSFSLPPFLPLPFCFLSFLPPFLPSSLPFFLLSLCSLHIVFWRLPSSKMNTNSKSGFQRSHFPDGETEALRGTSLD